MAPLLEFREISKAFGAVQANRDISFQVRPGTIHALVGENGAGKSTLMKILFGLQPADTGEILFRGKSANIDSPREAKRLGIGMIHQHFHLAPAITALDHVLLEQSASPVHFFERLDRAGFLKTLENLSAKFGLPVPWLKTTSELSVGIQQRVEILKLLAFDAKVLILDEPTAVLNPIEVEQFLERLRELRKDGRTIVLITHKLKEVFAVADDVTVLRQGRVVSSGPLSGETQKTLAGKMVGGEFVTRALQKTSVAGEAILKIENLSGHDSGRPVLDQVSFELKRGEILGIAGVEGNGQSELIRALTLPRESGLKFEGRALFEGRDLLGLDNSRIRELGLGLIPEDRLHQAVIPSLSAKENFQLGRLDLQDSFWLDRKRRDSQISDAIREFNVMPANADLSFASFSGGNQQKIVVARELGAKPKVLIVAQPTRGVDIGAIEQIYEAIIRARNAGLAVLLISSELEELLRLSDRLLVMYKGKINANLHPHEFDTTKIGCLMGGTT